MAQRSRAPGRVRPNGRSQGASALVRAGDGRPLLHHGALDGDVGARSRRRRRPRRDSPADRSTAPRRAHRCRRAAVQLSRQRSDGQRDTGASRARRALRRHLGVGSRGCGGLRRRLRAGLLPRRHAATTPRRCRAGRRAVKRPTSGCPSPKRSPGRRAKDAGPASSHRSRSTANASAAGHPYSAPMSASRAWIR